MNALTIFAVALLASPALSSAIGGGAILEGPSGIVTSNGVPIGPTGPAGTHLGAALIGTKAILTPAVSTVVASAPIIGIGHGGLGLGGLNGLGLGLGLNAGLGVGLAGIGGHGIGISGVAVQGPGTVPATIAGPSGKIVADGLWGPTLAAGHGGLGKW